MIRDALTYPVRRDHGLVLAVGVACFSVLLLVGPLLPGPAALLVMLLDLAAVLYFAIFFYSVMEEATAGRDRLPLWPEEVDGYALLRQAVQLLAPLILSFLPLIVLRVYWRNFGGLGETIWGAMAHFPGVGSLGAFGRDIPVMPLWAVWLSYGLAAVGFAYFPMAMLVFSFYGETAVVNVVGVARSIRRIARDYAPAVALLIALFTGLVAGIRLLDRLPELIAVPLSLCLCFYAMTAAMRVTGLLYARNKERLGWEPSKPPVPEQVAG